MILLKKLVVKIHLKDEGVLVYTFERGWSTDLASVPRSLRSFVDNDDFHIIIAALVHDSNFEGQFFPFSSANWLFYHMIRKSGGSWWFASKAFVGVHNWIGRRAYDKDVPTHNKQYKRFLMNWSDK